MALQQKIPIQPSQAIASYNYSDIADNTGTRTFYAAKAANYVLLTATMSSNEKELTKAVNFPQASGFVYSGNETTYSLGAFNVPATIEGTAYIEGYVKFKKTASPDGNLADTTIAARLYKNSTEIASGNINLGSVAGTTYNTGLSGNFLIDFSVPLTHYAKGDILKVSFIYGGDPDGGSGGTNDSNITMVMGEDPLDRDSTNIKPATESDATTVLKVHVPFRLDII